MIIPKEFLESAEKCGYDIALMQASKVSHIYVNENKILSSHTNAGLKMTIKSFSQGVRVKLVVSKREKLKEPIFLCFGVLRPRGKQVIIPDIILEEGSEAKIFAHCSFPQARAVIHNMKANIKLKKGSKLYYSERHYHGENFGANVSAEFKILLESNASFQNEFVLKEGSVGKLAINLEANLQKRALGEIMSTIVGRGEKDSVKVFDKAFLKGENSRSLMKFKGAVVNGGEMFFRGEAEAGKLARGARAHIDCQEIIVGKNSFAQSVPIVSVKNPEARITHEASVGKVNQKELETLMTRGLSEKEAIDFIIKGKLR